MKRKQRRPSLRIAVFGAADLASTSIRRPIENEESRECRESSALNFLRHFASPP